MEQGRFLAHIAPDGRTQTVREHLEGSADIASSCLRRVALSASAYLAALVHDTGKYTMRYQDYLCRASAGMDVKRGSVVHTFTGVKLLLERFHTGEDSSRLLSAELLAYAVGAHHGLFDCIDEQGRSGFRRRMQRHNVDYEEGIGNFYRACVSPEILDDLFLSIGRRAGACDQEANPSDTDRSGYTD